MNYDVWEAKSIMFKDGVPIIPDPFLETTVRWDKDTKSSLIAKGINKILEFKESIDTRCYMTDVQYETVYGHPQAIWALFEEKEDLFVSNCN